MKVYQQLKKYLMRSTSVAAFTLMSTSLVTPAHAASFTVDGVDQTWTSDSVKVDDVADAETVVVVDGQNDGATNLYTGCVQSDNANVSGNKLTVTDSQLNSVYGVRLSGSGKASQNHVTLTSSSVKSFLLGAFVTKGEISDNSVTVTDSTVSTVAGGYLATTGKANGNSVSITDSTVKGNVMGGWVNDANAVSMNNEANSNVVSITNSVLTQVLNGGYVKGNGASNDNEVTITDTKASKTVYGGYVSSAGTANNNRLTITGSKSTGTSAYAGFVNNGQASYNTLTVKDGASVGDMAGGLAMETGDATHNRVIIENATTTGDDVMGGAAINGNAIHNEVILRGENCNINSIVWGGKTWNSKYDARTGNVLTLDGFRGSVGVLYNFEAINITLTGANMACVNSTDGSYVLTSRQQSNLSGVKLTLNSGKGFELKTGDTINLFKNVTGANGIILVESGLARRYELTLLTENSNVVAQVGESSFNPQTKALAEGRVAALTFLNRAGNMVAEQGIEQAAHAAEAAGNDATVAAFFSMSSGHERVDSGSHVDADGLSAMLGASAGLLKDKVLTLGGFIESGWGQYTTYNSFEDADSVRGKGESSYCGGGILARYDFSNLGAKGLSVDASLRAGRQDADFSSYDLGGEYAAYDISSAYVAGHVGVGYTFAPADTVETSFYARYLWSHLGSEYTVIDGEAVDFDSTRSNRLRFGARVSWKLRPQWTPYAGLAYEWECSGAARAMVDGERVDAPSMRGGSVIGELGVSWQPSETKPLWVNAGLQGSAGKTQGYGANIGCSIAF